MLPTAGHRWLASEPGRLRILDCARPTLGEQSINSLMPHPTSILGVFSEPPTEGPVRRFWTDLSILDPVRPVSDCAEPGLAAKLAAMRYTHLLVRADYRLADRVPQEGLALERTFDDSSVYRIVAAPATVFTREIEGFYWRAGPPGSTHRWMGPTGTWVVVSRVAEPVDVDLELEIESLERPRQLIVLLGGREFARLDITTGWRRYRLEDLTLEPGANRLTLVPTGRPTVPAAISDSTDHRALTIAVRDWRWNP